MPDPNQPDNPTPPPPAENSVLASLKAAVQTLLVDSGEKVKATIIEKMAQEELAKRREASLGLISKLEEQYKELRKIKPSYQQGYTLEGAGIGEPSYTKEQVDQAKKVKEQIAKLEGALTKAFESNDFTKVLELGQGK